MRDVENVVLPDHVKMIRCSECGRDVERDFIAHQVAYMGRCWFVCYDCSPGKFELRCDGCGRVVAEEDCICAIVAGRSGVFCSTACMWEHPITRVAAADGGA